MAVVGEIGIAHPVTLPVDAVVRDAAVAMAEHGVGDVLVTEVDGSLYGIVTDRDLVTRLIAEDGDPDSVVVGSVASTNVVSIGSFESISVAAEVMAKHALQRLPVLSPDGHPTGVVSISDLHRSNDLSAEHLAAVHDALAVRDRDSAISHR